MANEFKSRPGAELEAIAKSPRYCALVSQRSRLTWTLTAIMLVIYFGYVVLIAFDGEFLARSLAGGTTTIGIPIGISVILTGVVLTGVYVVCANRRFDALERAVREEAASE